MQLVTGQDQSTLTSQGLQAAGVPKETAELIDTGISIGLTGVSGALAKTSQLSSAANATNNAAKTGINVIPEGKLANHIFSGKAGKLLDNAANRGLITDLTNNIKNLLGVDKYGKSWYGRTLDDGTQLYGYTQNGVVKGVGINKTPLNISKLQVLE